MGSPLSSPRGRPQETAHGTPLRATTSGLALTRRGVVVAGMASLTACAGPPSRPTRRAVALSEFGPSGDGRTSDLTAFRRALRAAGPRGTVTVPRGTFLLDEPLLLNDVRVVGVDGAELVRSPNLDAPLLQMGSGVDNVQMEGLTVRCAAGPTVRAPLIAIVDGAEDITVEQCVIAASCGQSIGVLVRGSAGVRVANCHFRALTSPVTVSGSNQGISISGTGFESWRGRAIAVLADASGATDNLRVTGCSIGPPTATVGPRQPLTVHGTETHPHSAVMIDTTTVTGPGRAWPAPGYGTGDQISLAWCKTFAIRENTSTDGGDMGITVSGGCLSGEITRNVCTRNDTGGIDLGSTRSTTLDRVEISDNVCVDNGQNRLGQRPAYSQCGIRLQQGSFRPVVRHNLLSGVDPSPQRYAVSLTSTIGATVLANAVSSEQPESAVYLGAGNFASRVENRRLSPAEVRRARTVAGS